MSDAQTNKYVDFLDKYFNNVNPPKEETKKGGGY